MKRNEIYYYFVKNKKGQILFILDQSETILNLANTDSEYLKLRNLLRLDY